MCENEQQRQKNSQYHSESGRLGHFSSTLFDGATFSPTNHLCTLTSAPQTTKWTAKFRFDGHFEEIQYFSPNEYVSYDISRGLVHHLIHIGTR